MMAKKMPDIGDYKYGFADKDVSVFRSERGLTSEIVEEISSMKEEPQWMLGLPSEITGNLLQNADATMGWRFRLFKFDEITYYVKPSEADRTFLG